MFSTIALAFSVCRRVPFILALLLATLSHAALAEGGVIALPSTNHSAALSKIVLGLLLVLLLIAALSWLLKRLPVNKSGGGHIRLIESYPLSTRERLLLVAVGREQILLAVGNSGIKRLHVLSEPLAEKQPAGGTAFSAQLAQFLPSLQRGRV
ncbi:flagellar biosynthetic protein FliO [Ventosimonas gracilis]|nr:flagellar biosynthetic protein FliO [Ventosimonas gracilis]